MKGNDVGSVFVFFVISGEFEAALVCLALGSKSRSDPYADSNLDAWRFLCSSRASCCSYRFTLVVFSVDTWNTPRIAQAFVKMAESGRAKVKEVMKYTE